MYFLNYLLKKNSLRSSQAISATSVMNDRICIESNGTITALFSPQKVVSCCENCGNGCNGGYTAAAWTYILKRGIVTGGDFGSNEVS